MNELRIKELLKERNITMTTLANALGVNRVNVYHIIEKPTYERLLQISEVLYVPVRDLFSSTTKNNVDGYLEYNGTIYKITSMRDIIHFVEKYKNMTE